MSLQADLAAFADEHRFRRKGPLSLALVITEQAKLLSFPLSPADFLTPDRGQVKGLSGDAAQAVLTRHGITRRLSTEGGRTSRGSIGNMERYVDFLNAHQSHASLLDDCELFWVGEVRKFFAAKPFVFRANVHHGLRTVIQDLIGQAEARQRDMAGVMYLGTMLQHLVGAKLEIVMGGGVEHNNSNANDARVGRTGDFDIGDTSIHVSTAPSEALIRKCIENINAGRRPIIVTVESGVAIAIGLARQAGVGESVDVLEFEQFLTSNLYEHGRFAAAERKTKIEELIASYNAIVDQYETDPSLRIEVAQGR